jgi:hypothetical protein
MPTDRWLTLERLDDATLGRPAEERTAFLAEACASGQNYRLLPDGQCLVYVPWGTEPTNTSST